jgi:hypothetical protein
MWAAIYQSANDGPGGALGRNLVNVREYGLGGVPTDVRAF